MRVLLGSFVLLPLCAQQILTDPATGGRPILQNGDMVVLEAGEVRRDLECQVMPDKPVLGFDLKFHAGYVISIPLKELEGQGDLLTVLFRVTPASGSPIYFSQQIRVPPIAEGKGDASLGGAFDLGEGSYHVDWLMHDYSG